MLVPQQQNRTIYGDSHFYSSYLMGDFLEGKIDPSRAFERCREHRAGTLLDSDLARAQLHCGLMFSGLALWHERFDVAFKWFEYLHWERRRPGTQALLSMDTGQSEAETFDEWKVRHDLEQLRHLARQEPSQRRFQFQVSPYAPLAPVDFVRRLGDAYHQLQKSQDSSGGGGAVTTQEGGEDSLETRYAALLPYYRRAVNVPHVERLEQGALNREADWLSLEAELLGERPVAGGPAFFLDGALRAEARSVLADYFRESTIWHSIAPGPPGGRGPPLVEARLREGLHAELLLQVAAELLSLLPRALAGYRLADIVAQKFDAEMLREAGAENTPVPLGVGLPGSLVRAAAEGRAHIAVALWTTADAANRDPAGNGFAFVTSDSPQASTFAVPYRERRVVACSAKRGSAGAKNAGVCLPRADWNPRRWRAGFRHRRVDLWFLFELKTDTPAEGS